MSWEIAHWQGNVEWSIEKWTKDIKKKCMNKSKIKNVNTSVKIWKAQPQE